MLDNDKNSIYMYEFYHPNGATVKAMELEGEGWILGPDILRFFGYKNPLREIEENVDPEDKRYILGVPFINKYVLYRFAYDARPDKDPTELSPKYYFREEWPLKQFCYWISHVVVGAMRGTEFLPQNDDDWGFHIWRKDECAKYLEEVRAAEEPIAESVDTQEKTATIPIYCHGIEFMNIEPQQLGYLHKLFSDAYDSDIDLKGFVNGFAFACGLMEHWSEELISELEEESFELQA